MTKEYRLRLQVANVHLRLIPQGPLNTAAVEQLLGVARSGLTFFPVVTVDLRGAWDVKEAHLTLLEEGLQQLISEKKLALTCEIPKSRWVVHRPPADRPGGKGDDPCQACPERPGDLSRSSLNNMKTSGGKPN